MNFKRRESQPTTARADQRMFFWAIQKKKKKKKRRTTANVKQTWLTEMENGYKHNFFFICANNRFGSQDTHSRRSRLRLSSPLPFCVSRARALTRITTCVCVYLPRSFIWTRNVFLIIEQFIYFAALNSERRRNNHHNDDDRNDDNGNDDGGGVDAQLNAKWKSFWENFIHIRRLVYAVRARDRRVRTIFGANLPKTSHET